jgi:ketosteroid isomerase-like protein
VGKLSACAQGTSDADAVSKILALESAWNQAVETRDTKALQAIFDNFLVYVEHDGRVMSKAEYLVTVKRAGGNPQQVTTEGMMAHIWGGTAIVTGFTAREAHTAGSHTTGVGGSSIPGYSRMGPGFASRLRLRCLSLEECRSHTLNSPLFYIVGWR